MVSVTLNDFESLPVARPDHTPSASPAAGFCAWRNPDIMTNMANATKTTTDATFMVVPLLQLSLSFGDHHIQIGIFDLGLSLAHRTLLLRLTQRTREQSAHFGKQIKSQVPMNAAHGERAEYMGGKAATREFASWHQAAESHAMTRKRSR
jgi:hypothetical protein